MFRRIIKTIAFVVIAAIAVIAIWPETKSTLYMPSADYVAHNAAYVVPPMPESWRYDYFTADDGTKLRWGAAGDRTEAKATVIFLPGYTSSLDMYGDHAARILARGYHIMGVDLRGQGGSDRHRSDYPEKLYAKDFGVYSDDIAAFIAAQNFDTSKPVILLGSSFGGHVALRVVGDHAVRVDGLVLLAPAYRPNTAPFSYGMTKAVVGASRTLGKDKRYAVMQGPWRPDGFDMTAPSECSAYPQRLYLRDAVYMRKPEQRVGGVTNNYLWGMMTSGEYLQTDDFNARITVPVIMVAASNDTIIDSAVSEAACRDSLPNCTLKIYPDTGHCLTLENDAIQERIIDELDILTARLDVSRG